MEQAGSSAQKISSRQNQSSSISSGLGPPEAVYIWDACIPLALREAAKTLPGQREEEATISKVFSREEEDYFTQWAGSWHDKDEQQYELIQFRYRQEKNIKFEFPTLQKWKKIFDDVDKERKRIKKKEKKKDADPANDSKVWAVLALKVHKESHLDKALVCWLPDKLAEDRLIECRGGQLALDQLRARAQNIYPKTLLTFEDLIPPVAPTPHNNNYGRNAAAIEDSSEESSSESSSESSTDSDSESSSESSSDSFSESCSEESEEGGDGNRDEDDEGNEDDEDAAMDTDYPGMNALKVIEYCHKSVIPEIRMIFDNLKLDANELEAFEFLRGKLEANLNLLSSDFVYGIFRQDDYLVTVLEKLNSESDSQVGLNVFAQVLDAFRDNSYLAINIETWDASRAENFLCMVCLAPNLNLDICASCKVSVHASCVRQPATKLQLDANHWLCARCQLSPEKAVTCFLCHQANGGVFERIFPKIWAHENCFSAWYYILKIKKRKPDSLNENKRCSICHKTSGICLNLGDDPNRSYHPSCCARQVNMSFKVKEKDKDQYGVCHLKSVSYKKKELLAKLHKETNELNVDAKALETKFKQKFEYSKTEFPVYLFTKRLIGQINQLVPINDNRAFVEALWAIWKNLPKRVTHLRAFPDDGDVSSEKEWKFCLQELYPADDEPMETETGGQSFEWKASKAGPSWANW